MTNKKKKPQDDKKKHQEIGVVYCIPVDKIGGIGEVIILWHNEQKKKKNTSFTATITGKDKYRDMMDK